MPTARTDSFISKWGYACLFAHSIDNCPYDPQDLHYYKLSNPVISTIDTGILCDNTQRTFSETRFTDIDLGYNWSCSSPLAEVSEDDDTYIVEGTSQYGQGTVSLSVTTPSGTTVYADPKTVQTFSSHDVDLYCEGGEGGPVGYSYPIYIEPFYYGDTIILGE